MEHNSAQNRRSDSMRVTMGEELRGYRGQEGLHSSAELETTENQRAELPQPLWALALAAGSADQRGGSWGPSMGVGGGAGGTSLNLTLPEMGINPLPHFTGEENETWRA